MIGLAITHVYKRRDKGDWSVIGKITQKLKLLLLVDNRFNNGFISLIHKKMQESFGVQAWTMHKPILTCALKPELLEEGLKLDLYYWYETVTLKSCILYLQRWLKTREK